MKYAAIDIETWGLFEGQPEKHRPESVAMVSIIVEDTARAAPIDKLPHYTVILAQDHIDGEPVALALNAWIVDAIARFVNGERRSFPVAARGPRFQPEDNPWPVQWMRAGWKGVEKFLKDHFPEGKITVAGKNVLSFDATFFPDAVRRRFRHRALDPTILVTDLIHDEVPPNLTDVKMRLGVPGVVGHDPYGDNVDVINCLRKRYGHFVADSPVVERAVDVFRKVI
jgi:hypothetical protein